MCWAGTASNTLKWAGWAENLSETFSTAQDVFSYYTDHWTDYGGWADVGWEWWMTGVEPEDSASQNGDDGPSHVDVEGAGFFTTIDTNSVVENATRWIGDNGQFHLMWDFIVEHLEAGYGIGLSLQGDIAHAITCWGYEVGADGSKYLYYSDSDDDMYRNGGAENAPNNLGKFELVLNIYDNLRNGIYFLEDYLPGHWIYLDAVSAIKQYDSDMVTFGSESFDSARDLNFSGSEVSRRGNVDVVGDTDYYSWVMGERDFITISVDAYSYADTDFFIYAQGTEEAIYSGEGDITSYSFWADAGEYYIVVEGETLQADYVATNNTYIVTLELDIAPPTVPENLSYELGGASNNDLAIDWDDADDGEYGSGVKNYDVQIASDSNFNNIIYSVTVDDSEAAFEELADGTYYWRVRAVDNMDNESAWGEVNSFIVDTVPPTIPENLRAEDLLADVPEEDYFVWDAATDAGSGVQKYIVEYSENADHSDSGTIEVTDTKVLVSALPGMLTYYWRVKAVDNGGSEGEWSDWVETYIPDNSAPSKPDGLDRLGENLAWNETSDFGSGVEKYIIEYADNIGFEYSTTKEVTANEIAISKLGFTEHNYYWRVQAIDKAGNESEWSDAKIFTLADSTADNVVTDVDYDNFGYSVSISGRSMAFGANGNDNRAHVYRWNGVDYDEYALSAGGGSDADLVSIYGDNVLVGAKNDGDNGTGSGGAYVYRWNDTTSSYDEYKLNSVDAARLDCYGSSVSISGDTVAIGVCGDDDKGFDSGSVYAYRWYAPVSSYEGYKLTASDGRRHDEFGVSVATSDNKVVVGADKDDDKGTDSGSVYVYSWNGSFYEETNKLTAKAGAAGDNFGFSVAISDNNIAVGAYNADDNGIDSGSAYVYRWNGSSYDEYKLTASDGAAGDNFGYSVSISGDYVVVGAYNDDDEGENSGSVYVYGWSGSSYVEVAKIIDSNGAAGDNFGISLSLSDRNLLVGTKNGSSVDSAYHYVLDELDFPELPEDPTGLSVEILAGGETAKLDWGDALNATEYYIQVDDDSDFSSPLLENWSDGDSEYVVAGLDNDAIYYWRVKAYNENVTSQWAQGGSFLIAPDDDSMGTATLIDVTDAYTHRDYVGIQDAVDFYTFTLDQAGSFDFELAELSSKASFTLYNSDGKKLKRANARGDSASINDILLDTGTYYVEVLSGDKGNGKYNTGYDLNITGTYFTAASDDNSFAAAAAYDLDGGGASGWVGFGDAYDYYTFDVTKAGTFDFSLLGDDRNAKLTVYAYDETRDRYKKLKGTSLKSGTADIENLLLDTGTYYVEVMSADKGRGKKNTDYDLDVTADYFPVASDDNSFAAATAYDLEGGGANGFVGFGDAQDVYTFTIDQAGTFGFELAGLDSKTSFNIYSEYDRNGVTKYKKLKGTSARGDSASINNILLEAGTYYVEVLSGDKGKGKYNTKYDLNITGDYFPEETVANEFDFRKGVGNPVDLVLNGDADGSADGWVGFGDAQDVYKFTVDDEGTFDISLTGLSSKVSFKLYSEYDSRGTTKYKRLKSASSRGDDISLDDLLLQAGNYYVEIISGDKGKGKYNTEYDLNINGIVPSVPVGGLGYADTGSLNSGLLDDESQSLLASAIG